MPYKVTRFESTPNPNALKCILDASISANSRSFRSPDQAREDPTAAALFEIPGITAVLMCGDWVSICKAPEADWPQLKRAVRDVLGHAPNKV